VSNDNKLKVGLGLASLNYGMEGLCESLDIVFIEIRRRFIKSNDLKIISSV
jgi:hypothetical protein